MSVRRAPARRLCSPQFFAAIVLLIIRFGGLPRARADEAPERSEAPRSQPARDVGDIGDAAPDTEDSLGPFGLRYYWEDTLHAESPDGVLKLTFGGRFMGDWAVYDTQRDIEDDIADFKNGTQIRRARVFYSGTLGDDFDFLMDVSLPARKIEAWDVHVGISNIPIIGGIRAGHIKEPFGMEWLTSSLGITFLERSGVVEAFSNVRSAGVMIHNQVFEERLTWAVGLYRDTDRFFDGEINRALHLTTRLTGLPVYEDEGRRLLHLGVAYSHRDLGASTVRFGARPESGIAPNILDTGNITANAVDMFAVEAAWVDGPFSLQGEYFHVLVNRHYGYDLEFNGLYVQASYFLTGEHRNYKKSSAAFDRFKPAKNFGEDGGIGAWEVAARYSYLDLNDADIRGGRTNDLTVGLSWYVNANTRFSWNYVYADPDDTGVAHIFQTRFQISF